MDEKLLAVTLGIVAGAVGYWVTTFWMKPILQYRELRTRIFADLIYFAQVVNAEGLSERCRNSTRNASSRIVAVQPIWPRAYTNCQLGTRGGYDAGMNDPSGLHRISLGTRTRLTTIKRRKSKGPSRSGSATKLTLTNSVTL
jgi:hypothetical protein